MPKYGFSLISVFPYMDRIISVLSLILTESENLSRYENIKYRYNSVHIGENLNQRKSVFQHFRQSGVFVKEF